MSNPQSDTADRVTRSLARDHARLSEAFEQVEQQLEAARERYEDACARESSAWPEVDRGDSSRFRAWREAMDDAERAQSACLDLQRQRRSIREAVAELRSPAERRRREETLERLDDLRARKQREVA